MKKKEKLTYRKLLALFAESDRRFDEKLEKERQEREEKFEKEHQEREQESALRMKEYNEKLEKERLEREKREQEYALRQQEAALRQQEADEKWEKEQKKIFKMIAASDKKIGELGNTLGRFVEEMVAPKLVKLFQKRGIEINFLVNGIRGIKDKQSYYEVDLLLFGEKVLVAVEVKTHLSVEDVKEHLERLEKMREIPPKYKIISGVKIYGAVAGMIIENDADRYAYKKGLFVLKQNGNMVDIINDDDFVLKEWDSDY